MPLTHQIEFTSMTEQLLQSLNINFMQATEINKKVMEINEKTDFSPKTCIAVATYLYLKDNSKYVSIPKLSKELKVSSMSMYRCLKRIL